MPYFSTEFYVDNLIEVLKQNENEIVRKICFLNKLKL